MGEMRFVVPPMQEHLGLEQQGAHLEGLGTAKEGKIG